MGIRESLNKNPGVTTAAVVAIVVAAVAVVYYTNRGPAQSPVKTANGVFYTEDDGATWYPGDYTTLARDLGTSGKPVARACVFRYGGEEPFVAWLEKYTDSAKGKLIRYYSIASNLSKPPPDEMDRDLLVKKPGGKAWVRAAQGKEIRTVPAKGGQEAKAVTPG